MRARSRSGRETRRSCEGRGCYGQSSVIDLASVQAGLAAEAEAALDLGSTAAALCRGLQNFLVHGIFDSIGSVQEPNDNVGR